MIQKLLLLFTVVPLVELILLLMFAQLTGNIMYSVILVIVTGALGAFLARRQGIAVLRRIREQMSQGSLPTDPLIDGAMIFFAGGLLLTPGVLTDFVGVSLLIPPCRQWYKGWVVRWFQKHFQVTQFTTSPAAARASDDPNTVDSYVVDPSTTPPSTEHSTIDASPPANE